MPNLTPKRTFLKGVSTIFEFASTVYIYSIYLTSKKSWDVTLSRNAKKLLKNLLVKNIPVSWQNIVIQLILIYPYNFSLTFVVGIIKFFIYSADAGNRDYIYSAWHLGLYLHFKISTKRVRVD